MQVADFHPVNIPKIQTLLWVILLHVTHPIVMNNICCRKCCCSFCEQLRLDVNWDENPDKQLLSWGGIEVNHQYSRNGGMWLVISNSHTACWTCKLITNEDMLMIGMAFGSTAHRTKMTSHTEDVLMAGISRFNFTWVTMVTNLSKQSTGKMKVCSF